MTPRKTSIIYESFYDAISDLEDQDFIRMMKAYCEYTLYGTEPQLSGCLLSMWKLIRPVLDKNAQLQENGSRGGRPRKDAQASVASEVAVDQPETNPKPKRNQPETKAEPIPKHDDLYMDMEMDMEKDLDKDISLSAKAADRGGREREAFLKILFFEKNILQPQVELERFTNHYAKCGWVDAHGNRIRNRAAALRVWSPDKDAARVPERTCALWREAYEAIRAADPGCDASVMLTDFRGLYGEGPNLYLTVGDAALRNFLEAPGRLPELRKVLNKFFGPDKVLIYRTPRS